MTPRTHKSLYIPRVDEDRRDWMIGLVMTGLIALCVMLSGLAADWFFPGS